MAEITRFVQEFLSLSGPHQTEPVPSSLLYHIVCPAKYRRVIFDPEVALVLRGCPETNV